MPGKGPIPYRKRELLVSAFGRGRGRTILEAPESKPTIEETAIGWYGAKYRVPMVARWQDGLTWNPGRGPDLNLVKLTPDKGAAFADLVKKRIEAIDKIRGIRDGTDSSAPKGSFGRVKKFLELLPKSRAAGIRMIEARLGEDLFPDGRDMPTIVGLGTAKAYKSAVEAWMKVDDVLDLELLKATKELSEIPPPPGVDAPFDTDEYDEDLSHSDDELDAIESLRLAAKKHAEAVALIGSGEFASLRIYKGTIPYPSIVRVKDAPWPKSMDKLLTSLGYPKPVQGEAFALGKMIVFATKGGKVADGVLAQGVLSSHKVMAHFCGGNLKEIKKISNMKDRNKATLALDALIKGESDAFTELVSKKAEAWKKQHVLETEEDDGKGLHGVATQVLLDDDWRERFIAFTVKEYSTENIEFVVAVDPSLAKLRPMFANLRPMMSLQGGKRVEWLFHHYVKDGPEYTQINISSKRRKQLQKAYKDPMIGLGPSVATAYHGAAGEIMTLLNDTLTRFYRDQ